MGERIQILQQKSFVSAGGIPPEMNPESSSETRSFLIPQNIFQHSGMSANPRSKTVVEE
jgi:hypothetical protein